MVREYLQKIIAKVSEQADFFPKTFNPPAKIDDINLFEAQLGFRLPDSFKELYTTHDGEKDQKINVFFGLKFMTLEEIVGSYRFTKEWDEDGDTDLDENIYSVPADHIQERYFYKGLIPIGEDGGGNYFGIDMAPGEKGTIGQVINFGRDEELRYVIAPDLTSFFKLLWEQYENDNFILREEEDLSHLDEAELTEEEKALYEDEEEDLIVVGYETIEMKNLNISHMLDAFPNFYHRQHEKISDIDAKEWYESLNDTWKNLIDPFLKSGVYLNQETNTINFERVNSLTWISKEIKDLTPIKAFRNVRNLVLTGNPIEDLTPLKELKDLRRLYLAGTNIKDISALSELKNLNFLSISRTSVTDFSPIEGLEKLQFFEH